MSPARKNDVEEERLAALEKRLWFTTKPATSF
jgi:hypothetical protein